MVCSYTIDNQAFNFDVDGDFSYGKDQILFQKEGNVLEFCSWIDQGYTIEKIFSDVEFMDFRDNLNSILKRIFEQCNIKADNQFSLEKYHKYVKTNEEHQAVISKTRFLTFRDFQIDMEKIIQIISKSVGKNLQKENPLLEEEIVIMRISRPSSLDINPLHRDGYLDLWENVLNLWIPLAGCGPQSSLPVIPRSHYWNEKDVLRTRAKGASINGLTYHVPAILSYKEGLNCVRPNPPYGSALLFTPFIVHGGAINAQSDVTRISLELRLYCPK